MVAFTTFLGRQKLNYLLSLKCDNEPLSKITLMLSNSSPSALKKLISLPPDGHVLVVGEQQGNRARIRNALAIIILGSNCSRILETGGNVKKFIKEERRKICLIICWCEEADIKQESKMLQEIKNEHEELFPGEAPRTLMLAGSNELDLIVEASEIVDGYLITNKKKIDSDAFYKKLTHLLRRRTEKSEKARTLIGEAMILIEDKEFKKAFDILYKDVLPENIDSARIRFFIGNLFKKWGDSEYKEKREQHYDKAEGWYLEAIEYDPLFIKALMALAELAKAREEHPINSGNSLSTQIKAIINNAEKNITHPKILIEVGIICLEFKNQGDAKKAFELAGRWGGNFDEIGGIYFAKEEYKVAEDYFRQALIREENWNSFKNLILALEKQAAQDRIATEAQGKNFPEFISDCDISLIVAQACEEEGYISDAIRFYEMVVARREVDFCYEGPAMKALERLQQPRKESPAGLKNNMRGAKPSSPTHTFLLKLARLLKILISK